jgi:transposase
MLETWVRLSDMKPLTISDREEMILALQDEIRRSGESRYDHRLHGVLLIAEGLTCPQVSELLGDAPRTVEYWVRRFEGHGFGGLTEGERSGRPSRLTEQQLAAVETALRQSPAEVGLAGVGPWDGKTLSSFLKMRFDVDLRARQCQRLFRRLGFRLRKPRPLIAHADPQQQAAYKKTPKAGQRRKR